MRACPSCAEENPDRARFCLACASPLETPAILAERKVVTALFCDLVGSTALGETHDPEVLEPLLAAYFDDARAAVERHGGTVEKYIGDAVAAVFGVPVVHEDDALRAVRAAAAIQAAVSGRREAAPIAFACRIGLATGEVLVAGDGAAPVGDVMNTAARLQAAAAPDAVLLAEPTYRLVKDAVRVAPIEAVEAKGKAAPVPAHRLLEVLPDTPGVARHRETPFVGRERERRSLVDALDRAVEDAGVQLYTLVGAAGIGKTRLVEEFMAGAASGAAVVRGRCLAYGDGITFWPIVEIVRAAAGVLEGDPSDVARAKIAALLPDGADRATIVERVTELMGLGAVPNPDETFWAIRRLLEALAARRPLVCVIEDLHWAEPRLLDLIDHIADWSRGSPILLLCDARPEFLEARPSWAGGKVNATTVLLRPLDTGEVGELVARLLGRSDLADEVIARIVETAEGNPLFVEQLLAMLADQGVLHQEDGRWTMAGGVRLVVVPPTIQALLGARLDALDASERRLLEAAAVEGRTFHVGSVAVLCDLPRSEVAARLAGLVRSELLRPDVATLEGEEAYRFRHILITDAAYRAIPKRTRAELHERFADLFEARLGDRVPEYHEILGYHLAQAVDLRAELGLDPDPGLAERATAHLGAAGRRALARGDSAAAVTLLERATALIPGSVARLAWVPDLAWALVEIGRADDAVDLVGRSLASTSEAEAGLLWHRLASEQVWLASDYGDPLPLEQAVWACDRAADAARSAGDDLLLARALSSKGRFLMRRADIGAARDSFETAIEAAIRSGDVRAIADAENWQGGIYCWGPHSIDEAVAFCERSHALQVLRDRLLWAYSRANVEARRSAFRGDFPAAHRFLDASVADFLDLGSEVGWVNALEVRAEIDLLAGDMEAVRATVDEIVAARGMAADAVARLRQVDAYWLAWMESVLGDRAAAERWSGEIPVRDRDDPATRLQIDAAEIRIDLLHGRADAASDRARSALAAARGTGWIDYLAALLEAAAEAFAANGALGEQRSVLGELADAYRLKGNLVGLESAERRLAALPVT